MIELLLLGILIMQIITFHNNAPSSGRYMKYYDLIAHQFNRYLRHKAWLGCCKVASKGKTGFSKGTVYYQKIKEKGVKLWQMTKTVSSSLKHK